MKIKIKSYAKMLLSGFLTLALVLQAFHGIGFNSKASTSTLPVGFTELGWADFGLSCQEYTDPSPSKGHFGSCSTTVTSLHQTLFSGNVIFNGPMQVRYGGSDGYNGLLVRINSSGNLKIENSTFATSYAKEYKADAFGLTTFDGVELNLKISTEISGTEYTFGVWINDIMAGDYFTLTAAGNEGLNLGLYHGGSGSITLCRDKLPTDYTTYKHKAFNIPYGTYTSESTGVVKSGSVSGITNFNETIIHFPSITFQGDTALNFQGKDGWTGFKIYHSSAGVLMITSGYGELISGIYPDKDVAGVENISGPYDLKITTKYIDDTHMKLGVWFNDVLYNNQYIQVNLANVTKDKLGLSMGLQINEAGGSIILEEKNETLPSDYTIYTPKDFNVPYAVYTPATSSAAVSGHISASDFVNFDKSIIHFEQITFQGDVDLNFAGTSGWEGFKLRSNSSVGTLELSSGYGNFVPDAISLTDDIAGVDLMGGSYDLKISIVYTNTATIKMGLWFNDVLYNNEYFTIDVTESGESNTDELGSYMGITYVAAGGTIILSEIVEELPTDYTVYTPEDFGVDYGTYTPASGEAAVSGHISASDFVNFDKSIIQFEQITFQGDVDLNFAGVGGWEGFKLRASSVTGALTLCTGYNNFITSPIELTDDVAGVDLVGGAYDLKISIIYTNATTIKMGLWFNDVLYDNEYFTINVTESGEGNTDKLGSYMGITYVAAGGTIILAKQVVELTNLTWEDFGIEYETYNENGTVASKSTTSLLNTSFRDRVVFNRISTDNSNYWIGYGDVGSKWIGLRIFAKSDGSLQVNALNATDYSYDISKNISASEVGLERFIDIQFELGIDLIQNGNDAEVYLYIEGEQYNTDAWVWKDAVTNGSIGNNVTFIVNGGSTETGDVIIAGREPTLEQLPEDFMTITLNDFGVENGEQTYVDSKQLAINGVANLDRKILSTDVSCLNGSMQFFYGATSDTYHNGLYFLFEPDANRFILTNGGYGSEQYVFTSSEGGFDLSNGQSVNLKITTEFVNADEGESKNDVKVGVFINGVLYNNEYIVINDYVEKMGDYVNIRQMVEGASLTISTPKRVLPSGFTPVTFKDVGIGVEGETLEFVDQQGGNSIAFDWDKTIFSGKVSFGQYGSEIRLGTEDGWSGYRLEMDSTKQCLTLKWDDGSATDIATFTGVTLGETFSFSFVTEYVDVDNDGAEDDLKFGLWVNGVMYGNRWFYHVDYQLNGAENSGFTFCMPDDSNARQCTLTSYLPSTEAGTQDNGKYYYNLAAADKGYLLSTNESITVNGVDKPSGDVLDIAGDYTIVRTEGATEYTTVVVLYQTGDAHPDGELTSADLVAVKKAVENVELSTEAGIKGADANKDNKVDIKDFYLIREALLEKESIDTSVDVPTLSFASGQTNVMPIGGFYGAYGDLLNEDVYKKIQDSGINLVTWSIDTYGAATDETAKVERQLELAEQYGVSLFLRDYWLNKENKEYTAGELSDRIAAYSMYESFKGVTVIDEPAGTYYYSDDSTSFLADYNYVASSANSYLNLTGYANLYPLDASLGDATAYQSYLDEYCSTYNPKMLSFDDYPFNEANSVTVRSCEQYFENLAVVRNKAVEEGIPFWTFVQAGKWFNNSSWLSKSLTASQMKWNANIALAFGAKGIQYFPMVQPNVDEYPEYEGSALIDTAGNTTEWYDYAKNINAQIGAVDDVLMNSINVGLMLDGTAAENNIADSGVPILTTFNQVTGITSSDSTAFYEYGAVAGCFDYQGKTALYVVNYSTEGNNNITLTFDASYTTQAITSAGVTESTGSSLTVQLGAGEATLVLVG